MNIKNCLVDGLLFLHGCLRSRKALPENQRERFLIVSTTGLGDTLWATPAIRALRMRFPQSYIAVLTSGIGHQILEHNPHIDEIFTVGDPAVYSLFRHYGSLKKRNIDTALIFHTSQRPILPFCKMIGAKEIMGTEGLNKGLDHLLTHRLPRCRQHEILRRLNIASSADVQGAGLQMEFFLSPDDEAAAAELIERWNIPPFLPIVGLHPGAKDKYKQWHPEGFIALGHRLYETTGCHIVITGNSEEKPLVDKIAASIPHAIPLAGRLPLRTSAALIKKMALMVSNDTGPMHVAFAMHTPTVVLFGPTDPALCGPLTSSGTGSRATVLAKPRTCTPCLGKKCRDPFCMLQISVDDVYHSALRSLSLSTE